MTKRHALYAAAIATLAAGPAFPQDAAPFGQGEDRGYAAELWETMVAMDLAGDDPIAVFPYRGVEPHGFLLETLYTDATIDGHTGTLVIKRNYGPEGLTIAELQGARAEHLASVTVMFKRDAGYDPENQNWFWAKYLPDGSLDRNRNGVALAGRVAKGAEAGCIACHAGADGNDYLYTTDALD